MGKQTRREVKARKCNSKRPQPKLHVGGAIANAVRVGDFETAAQLLRQAVLKAQPPAENAAAEPLAVQVTLAERVVTVGSSICPGCNRPVIQAQLAPVDVARLKVGQQVEKACSECGQRQLLEAHSRAIVTPRQDAALRVRGL